MQYCSSQHQTYFYHQSHPQLGVVFALALSLQSFWSYFSSDLQLHIGYLPTWEVHLSVSYLSFHTVYLILKARILKWFAIPFSSGPHSVRPLLHDPPVLGCPDDAVKVLHSICQQIWKLSSGHRTGKGQFLFKFQRKKMPKNSQTTAQLHSSHMLVQ